jgi:hypothetical protein
MEVRKQITSFATPKRLAIVAAIAITCAGFTAPAFADGTEDVLNVLHAKGILSDSEYESLLKKLRAENKQEALVEAKAAQDTEAAIKKAASSGSDTKISGKMYADFTNLNAKFTPAVGPAINGGGNAANVNGLGNAGGNGTGLDVKRFYLIVDHKFDDMWSANLTTDMHLGRDGINDTAGSARTDIFVKKAYVQATVAPELFIRAGAADMPWIPYVESLYGYRYIENTITDKIKVGNSSDWGVHAGGKVADGVFNYAASVVNGNGYSLGARQKSPDFEGRVNVVPITGLDLALGYYTGTLGKDTQINENAGTVAIPNRTQNATREDFLVSYVMPDTFRVGGEYFIAKNYAYTQVLSANPLPSEKAQGYSLWGSVNLTKQFVLFARYDKFNPYENEIPAGTSAGATTTATQLDSTYYNLGLSYNVTKGVDVALVWKHEEDDNINTLGTLLAGNTPGLVANGGATNGAPGGQTKIDELGVWTQIAW